MRIHRSSEHKGSAREAIDTVGGRTRLRLWRVSQAMHRAVSTVRRGAIAVVESGPVFGADPGSSPERFD